MMASVKEQEFREVLLSGNGIRKDNGAHDFYDIIERNKISSSNGCVGCGCNKRTKCADGVLKSVLKSLEKEGYIVVVKTSDIYKGSLKSVIYYLAEE